MSSGIVDPLGNRAETQPLRPRRYRVGDVNGRPSAASEECGNLTVTYSFAPSSLRKAKILPRTVIVRSPHGKSSAAPGYLRANVRSDLTAARKSFFALPRLPGRVGVGAMKTTRASGACLAPPIALAPHRCPTARATSDGRAGSCRGGAARQPAGPRGGASGDGWCPRPPRGTTQAPTASG